MPAVAPSISPGRGFGRIARGAEGVGDGTQDGTAPAKSHVSRGYGISRAYGGGNL
jgi:hypothetical protein